MAAARGPMAAAGRIDAHLHVWAPAEEAERFPFAGSLAGSDAKNEPPLPGHAGLLLAEMEAAGVDRAVIVQPGNHAFDHRYVSSVLQAHPDRFIGMLLADPDPSGSAWRSSRRCAGRRATGACGSTRTWPAGGRRG